MNRTINFLNLFLSSGTLLCCALPALFVALGAGATFAGIVSNVPQLLWLSENKEGLFIFGGIMLITSYFLQKNAEKKSCPIDPKLSKSCQTTRNWSKPIFRFSILLYIVGFSFAYILPKLI